MPPLQPGTTSLQRTGRDRGAGRNKTAAPVCTSTPNRPGCQYFPGQPHPPHVLARALRRRSSRRGRRSSRGFTPERPEGKTAPSLKTHVWCQQEPSAREPRPGGTASLPWASASWSPLCHAVAKAQRAAPATTRTRPPNATPPPATPGRMYPMNPEKSNHDSSRRRPAWPAPAERGLAALPFPEVMPRRGRYAHHVAHHARRSAAS